ncbi:hypothetical protein HZB08_02215, partial [Candidatus Saganbacteria bacterium]|nr:hypothetical protein [Candidatus Saganbacteria bacterium]
MRLLDNIFGFIPELVVAVLFFLSRIIKPRSLSEPVKSLVIIKVFGMGSVFLIKQTLDEFQKPEELILVTFDSNRDIAQKLG